MEYEEYVKELKERREDGILYCENCGNLIDFTEFANGCCPKCGKVHPEYRPKKKLCLECGSKNKMRDKYCRYCGSGLDKEFKPYLNIMETIYGPPPFRTDFVCKSCGHKWSGYDDEEYCPKCGKEDLDTTITEDKEWLERWGY